MGVLAPRIGWEERGPGVRDSSRCTGQGQHVATDILRTDILRMVRGSSFAIGTIRRSGLTVAFVPQPTDREELNVYPLEMLLQRAAATQVAAE